MKTSSTADIVKVLEKNNELIRIKHEVDPYLQMAEIQRRIYRDNGPAILLKMLKIVNFNVYQTFMEPRKEQNYYLKKLTKPFDP